MKRAQSMGINLVIITAIALLVLLIIAIVVSQSGGDIREGLAQCSVNGGECINPSEATGDQRELTDYECGDPGDVCYSIT